MVAEHGLPATKNSGTTFFLAVPALKDINSHPSVNDDMDGDRSGRLNFVEIRFSSDSAAFAHVKGIATFQQNLRITRLVEAFARTVKILEISGRHGFKISYFATLR